MYNYRPQRSCKGYVFTGGGGVCLTACWDTTPPRSRHPPGADTPQADTPQADTPQEQTLPRADTPWKQTPLEQTPPGADHPPPRDTVTAADGTHPTGIHSCVVNNSILKFVNL